MTLPDNMMENVRRLLDYAPDAPLLFSSGTFWVLFLLFIPLFAAVRGTHWKRIAFVIAFSLYFYYKSSGWYFLLLVATSLVDWLLSKSIYKSKSATRKRACAVVSIVTSLSVLVWFKYANFFLWNWNVMIEGNFQPLDIILPVGISFYTFQSISYIVDVYRGDVAPTATWPEYLFFLSFFPALVAGPIVRAQVFLPQIRQRHEVTMHTIYAALWLILSGVLKKALAADYISQFTDLVFETPTSYSGFENLMASVGYTMQIYLDFSGYSDMAIGLSAILGFRLPENFNFPYRSTSVTEFWRRWHISLSSWLRDYLYIPLGGNRKGVLRTYVNNFLTMLIGGLWHGAAWKFVFWGALHGLGLAVNKAFRPLTSKVGGQWWFKALSWVLTMAFVAFLWIFFRSPSWSDSWEMVRIIVTEFDYRTIMPFVEARTLWVSVLGVVIVMHAVPVKVYGVLERGYIASPLIIKIAYFMICVQLVLEFASEEVAPFIYFQF